MSSEVERTPGAPAVALPVGVPPAPRGRALLPPRGFGSKLAAYVVVLLISIISLPPVRLRWNQSRFALTRVSIKCSPSQIPTPHT